MFLSGWPRGSPGSIARAIYDHRSVLWGAANRLARGTHHHVTRHVEAVRMKLAHPVVAIVVSAFLWLAIFALVALALGGAANAQGFDVYDQKGRRIESVVPDNAGNLDVPSLDGRRVETVKPDALGGSRVEDRNGRTIEPVQPSDAMGELPTVEEGGEPDD